MTTYTFEEVKRHAHKSGHCRVCGKPANRQTVFYQTLNPFNKAVDGTLKTRGQIQAELRDEVAAWESKPIVHLRCEASA